MSQRLPTTSRLPPGPERSATALNDLQTSPQLILQPSCSSACCQRGENRGPLSETLSPGEVEPTSWMTIGGAQPVTGSRRAARGELSGRDNERTSRTMTRQGGPV
jgi:hypothetical protein